MGDGERQGGEDIRWAGSVIEARDGVRKGRVEATG
jgi:hypothetical protein